MSSPRYDQGAIVLMSNGTYLMGVTVYDQGGGGDASPASIGFYTSTDLDNWTFSNTLSSSNVGYYIPSFYIKANGNILLVMLEIMTPATSRLVSYISTTNGASWGNSSVVRENVEYLNCASNRLFVTDTGRLVFPFAKNTNGVLNSQTGNYEGHVVYSDDEGANWSTSITTINSSDNLFVEPGVFKKDGSTLTLYFRNRSSVIFASNSTDNGATWGAVYDIGLDAIDSQSTILRLSSGTFLASYNPLPNRKTMQMARSDSSFSWNNYFILNNDALKHFIEPFMYEQSGVVHVFYSKSDNTQSTFSLCKKKITI